MLVSELVFVAENVCDDDTLFTVYIPNVGRITVLDRLTGYIGNVRDVETGFRNMKEEFWLASGLFDIRNHPKLTIEEAVELIKENANTCYPYNEGK